MSLFGAASRPSALTAATSAAAALTEDGAAVGGTNNLDIPALTTVGDPPTQAQVTAIRDGLREVAAAYNTLRTAHAALIVKHNALLARLQES